MNTIRSDDRSTRDGEPLIGQAGVEEAAPLYRRIAKALQGEIEAGTFAVGAMLPTESELCARFEVSRHTIRDALRVVGELGMVSRRQGSGTLVAAAAPAAGYVQSMRSLAELSQYARDTHYAISRVEQVTIAPEIAQLIPAASDSRWIKVEGVRWGQQPAKPICATNVYVHLRFAPHLHDVRETQGPIYDLIEQRSGERIAEAVQEISAEPMPRNAARALGLRTGTPSLRFVRRYFDISGSPMLSSVNWHPAEHFVYRMRLRRDG